MAIKRLEKKWRALPPDREIIIRREILEVQQEALAELREKHGGSHRNIDYFIESIGFTERRIEELNAYIADSSAEVLAEAARLEEEKARAKKARQRARLRENSQRMVDRFLVVTSGFNDKFLEKLGVDGLGDLDVDALLRARGIRLVTLDNPDRWAPGGENITQLKLLGLHPSDVNTAMKIISLSLISEDSEETLEKERFSVPSVIVWLPKKKNGWQHPDPERTVYPPKITRLALNHKNKKMPKGWGTLRGWGTDLEKGVDPINGCEVEFDEVPEKGRYEAGLDPDDVAEILL